MVSGVTQRWYLGRDSILDVPHQPRAALQGYDAFEPLSGSVMNALQNAFDDADTKLVLSIQTRTHSTRLCCAMVSRPYHLCFRV